MKLTAVCHEPALTRLESAEDITLLDFHEGISPLDEVLGQGGFEVFTVAETKRSGQPAITNPRACRGLTWQCPESGMGRGARDL